jgi:asparagine synthase (glutamine-hydrolysing)
MGNAGMSWGGDFFSQSLKVQLRHFGWRRWAREAANRHLPLPLLSAYRSMRTDKDNWWRSSAINPDFANRLGLLGRLLDAQDSPMSPKPRSPFERRCRLIRPEGSFVGGIWAEVGAAFGLEVRDPTADARVLTFIFSVPDRIFIDPETGLDRWLIREAMKERLPDEVRLNRRRGRQAGDRVPRLRACAEEVETALVELAAGPAAEYVNVPYMREVWRMIETEDSPEAFRKSATILTRGIMAGLWVNGFSNAS